MTRIISRYFDIIVYSFLSWLILSFSLKIKPISDLLDVWVNFQSTIGIIPTAFIYFISGLLTKSILINSGDYHYNHALYNEELYIIKNKASVSSIGWFDLKLKLKQYIVNPPLRLSIFIFSILVYCTNDIKLLNYFTVEVIFYLIGLKTPKIITSIKNSLAEDVTIPQENEETFRKDWYQYEKPITSLSQDFLNRKQLVNRLCKVISSQARNDTRGISIIGTFGIGKSSIINMTLTELQKESHNYIPCRIDTWGTYNSDEQLQKHLIEQIINSLGRVTSITSLNGLPSKYIHSLKGAQSLWLDALPLFDNHSSPYLQLAEIDSLLFKLKLNIIVIIEDLDRNKDAEAMLHSIAPLIDQLNHHNNFRFILSISEGLNSPSIINRISRYKEYLHFNHEDIFSTIHNTVSSLLDESNNIYNGDIYTFFKDPRPRHSQARLHLFSYVSNPRDLKLLLREFTFDWVNTLDGSCDIIDLLAITILKHHEPSLVTFISTASISASTDIEKDTSGYSFENPAAAKYILKYFFAPNLNTERERAQCCSSYPQQYKNVLIEKKALLYRGVSQEEVYFTLIKKINTSSVSTMNTKDLLYINTLLSAACKIKTRNKVISDLKNTFNKESIIPILASLHCHLDNKEKHNYSEILNSYSNDISLEHKVTNNIEFIEKIIAEIAAMLLPSSIQITLNFYEISKAVLSPHFNSILKPSFEKILDETKIQAYRENDKFNPHALYFSLELIRILHHEKVDVFVNWLSSADHKISSDSMSYINSYKYDGYTREMDETIRLIRSYLQSEN